MEFKIAELNAPRIEPLEAKYVVAHFIEALTVETDSVVATLNLTVSPNTEQVVVYWGDGPPEFHDAVALSAVNYQWRHAYDAPDNGLAFDRWVTVIAENRDGTSQMQVEEIRLVPRYRLTVSTSSIRLISGCDPSYEHLNEFRITLTKPDDTRVDWQWKPSNDFFPSPWFPLGQSSLQDEVVPDDGEYTISSVFYLTESDWIESEKGFAIAHVRWDHSETEVIQRFDVRDTFGGCQVELRYYRQARLLRPNLQGPVGPVFVDA